MKNVVVCCDGTANEFATDKTNVLRLFSVLERSSRQTAGYFPGIGTMEPPGALSDVGRRVTRGLARAVGYGLETEIRNAYAFVMQHYEEGDVLYLFGFSRGAYTVRAVASLLRMYGLLPQSSAAMLPYAIRLLTSVNDVKGDAGRWFNVAKDFKASFPMVECKPHFVGVWDTVSSVGWIANPLRLPYTASNPDIAHGRHVVSIDERRAFFRTNLWVPQPNSVQDLKQVWFAGVHSDVGGGYPEAEGALSKVSLRWMLREAAECGLLTDEAKVESVTRDANANALMHDSLTPLWWPAEFVPKSHWNGRLESWKLNRGRKRAIPDGALIHSSVRNRNGYAPELPSSVIFVD